MSENLSISSGLEKKEEEVISRVRPYVPPPSLNDGRFDDIDDEDPMEGIEIPKHLLEQQESEAGDLQTSVGEPLGKVKNENDLSHAVCTTQYQHSATLNMKLENSFGSEPQAKHKTGSNVHSRLQGSRALEILKGVLNEHGTDASSVPSSSQFRSIFSMPATNRPHIAASIWGSPIRHDESTDEIWPHATDSKKCPLAKSRHGDDFPIENFEQPAKVKKVEPDVLSPDPMQFLMQLRRGRGRYGRGYSKKISLMSFDTPKQEGHTRFVCVSDTHNEHASIELPEGDVLIHCGDFSLAGTLQEVDDFNDWLGEVRYKHKIVIAGNHELSFDKKIMANVEDAKKRNRYVRFERYLKPIEEKDWQHMSSRLNNCTYLEDSEVTINGIRIWGSPWQPEFGGWGFNVTRGQDILEKWNKIPGDGIDVLMTHGPPAGHGDRVLSGQSVGCVDLLNTIQLRVQPKYHLFGHIHEDSGVTTDQFTTYINCSSVNYHYEPVHKPFIFDLPNKE